MLKRFINLSLQHKKLFPVVQSRFIVVNVSKNDEPKRLDNKNENKIINNDILQNTSSIVPVLVEHLHCTPQIAETILEKHHENIDSLTLTELTNQLQLFINHGIDRKVLLQFPEIILTNPTLVEERLEIIKEISDGKNLTDFFPLLRMSVDDLKKVKKKMLNEKKLVPNGSRIHFLSNILSIEPYIISNIFSNYLFFFEISLRLIQTNANILLQYKIPVDKILKDPWIFRYSSKIVKDRLEEARKVRGGKLMPWMVHCLPSRLKKSLKHTAETKAIHKEMKSSDILGYLSNRFGMKRSEMETYMKKYPQSLKVRVTKIKSIIDFLVDEAGYTQMQVIETPRILTFSLKQIKERHEELKKLGYQVKTLMVFCLTKRTYSNLIEKIKKPKSRNRKR